MGNNLIHDINAGDENGTRGTATPSYHDRASILAEAARIVAKDRNATHGEPEDSFAAIAGMWSAYLGCRIASTDVAAMMALLKVARIRNNPANADNWIDLAGYAACGAEVGKAERS